MKLQCSGKIIGTKGPLLSAELLGATLGSWCIIEGRTPLHAQVVDFYESTVLLAPLGETAGMSPYATVRTSGETPRIEVGDHLLGSVVNALGIPFQHSDYQSSYKKYSSLYGAPPQFFYRKNITEQLTTGIKTIDAITPIGYGQRIGVIAPAGVGKSTLLQTLAERSDVDVVVIGLIGERGREVQEFIESMNSSATKNRYITVVSTSDEPSILRATAPYTATTIAEYFRDQGKRVLLLIDSLTRTARAIRDVGLSTGEIPVRHGYTPSVYAALPKLIERAGNTIKGSITACYSLLGTEEQEDPLAEEVKSLLDGHIVLSRQVAEEGIRPSVDILKSLSRLSERLLPKEVQEAKALLLRLHQRLLRDRDIITFGGIPDDELKMAIAIEPVFRNFRHQGIEVRVPVEESFRSIVEVARSVL